PKKRRIKKNVEEVKLWVETGNLLPLRIDYVGKDGNGREIRFLNTRLNPDLAACLYHVDIPKDVPVSTPFSGFDVASPGPHGPRRRHHARRRAPARSDLRAPRHRAGAPRAAGAPRTIARGPPISRDRLPRHTAPPGIGLGRGPPPRPRPRPPAPGRRRV